MPLSINLLILGFKNQFMSILCQKKIKRRTANTIVSSPNPKQWPMDHTSDLIKLHLIYMYDIVSRA